MSRLHPYLKIILAIPEGAADHPLLAAIKIGYLLLFLLLPLSIPVQVGASQIELPGEALVGVLAMLLVVWFWKNGRFSLRFYRSPITLAALAFLGWMGLTVPFSSDPVTSAKYVFVAWAHAWVLYHGAGVLLLSLPRDFHRLWNAYTLTFGGIIAYAWTVHAKYHFRIDASVLTARPFYADHALYSCCMLLLAGVFLAQSLNRASGKPAWQRRLSLGIGLFLLVGVYLSFSRGAWIGLVGASAIVGLVVVFKLRFRALMAVLAGGLVLLVVAGMLLVRQNPPTKPPPGGNSLGHIASVTNLTTNVSNLERINRYSCAWRMFLDRPVMGFGPGTYQVAYLPYQRKSEMTRISVTHAGPHPAGRGGGAHSEYLQALSETGAPGALAWMALVLAAIWTALHNYRTLRDPAKWLLVLGLLFGLFTYFLHGWLNNFLHHGKVAALFWLALAALNWLYVEATGVQTGG